VTVFPHAYIEVIIRRFGQCILSTEDITPQDVVYMEKAALI